MGRLGSRTRSRDYPGQFELRHGLTRVVGAGSRGYWYWAVPRGRRPGAATPVLARIGSYDGGIRVIDRLSRRRVLAASLATGAAALLGAACAPLQSPRAASSESRAPKSMTFMAGYKPQANVSFVGVYVANDLGYFKAQQLDVTIKHSTGQGEHAKLLAGKQVQVITETATDLIKNQTDQNVPFVSLAGL